MIEIIIAIYVIGFVVFGMWHPTWPALMMWLLSPLTLVLIVLIIFAKLLVDNLRQVG